MSLWDKIFKKKIDTSAELQFIEMVGKLFEQDLASSKKRRVEGRAISILENSNRIACAISTNQSIAKMTHDDCVTMPPSAVAEFSWDIATRLQDYFESEIKK